MTIFSIILSLLLLISSATAWAQPSWARVYGGPDSQSFNALCKSNDGALLLAGGTGSYGALGLNSASISNIYLVKTDTMGNLIWQKSYDVDNFQDAALSVIQVPNGDIFLSGTTQLTYYGFKYIFVKKVDSDGNEIWSQTFGSGGYNEPGRMVGVDNDIVITGSMFINTNDMDIWLTRIGNAGNIVWSHTYSLPDIQKSYGLCKIHDGGFLLSGMNKAFDDTCKAIVMRTNATGDSLWYKKVEENGAATNNNVILKGCTELIGDTTFALTGTTPDYYGNLSALIMDLNGNVTQFYKSSFLADAGYDIKPLSNGGFIVVGGYSNFGFVGALYRFSQNGGFMWSRRYFGIGGSSYHTYSTAYAVLPASDGGFYAAGSSSLFGPQYSGKSLLFKTNSAGDLNIGSPISISIAGNPTFCTGGSAVLSVPNDYDHYQWIWYNYNNQVSDIENSDTCSITVDSSRAYLCIMWDDDGTIAMSSTKNITVSTFSDTILTVIGLASFCPPLINAPNLKVTYRTGNTYQWFLDGNLMNGFTANQLTPQISGSYTLQINNACTTITTPPVQITAGGPPAFDFAADTVHLAFYNGASAACDPIQISVYQLNGVSYQWFRNGIPLNDTTSYISTNVDGYYYLYSQNLCGAAWSDSIRVVYDTIHSQLGYSYQMDPTSCANANLGFFAPYTSSPGAWFNWYKNGQVVYSAGQPSGDNFGPGILTGFLDSGYYYCQILNEYCGGNEIHTTDSIYYVEDISSRVLYFPNGGIGVSCSGAPLIISAAQNGATYQWYLNGVILPGETQKNHTATVTGEYSCEITRSCGSYFSNETNVLIGSPNVISSSASALCRSLTDTVMVKLEAEIIHVWDHQWRYNGVPIAGATNYYYNTKIPGFYDCIIMYSCDTIISNSILLMDYYIPKEIFADNYGKICPGGVTNLHVSPGFSYQWYHVNGSSEILIQGETDSIFTTDSVGRYFAMISNNFCSVESEKKVINQQPIPSPNNICPETFPLYCGASPVNLAANNRYDITYQWYLNGFLIAGATLQEYNATLPGSYQVQLTDSVGCSSLSLPLITSNQYLNNVIISGGAFNNVCQDSSVNLSVNGSYSSYQWYYNGLIIPGATGNSFNTDSAGLYMVLVADTSGCSGTASTQVNVTSPPSINSVSTSPSSCQGATGQISISFNTSVAVSWTGPTYIAPDYQISYSNKNNLLPGWYHFIYQNYGGGCVFTDSIEVQSQTSLYVNIDSGTGNLCQGTIIYAGASYNQYLWSTGQTTSSIIPQTTGWYTLTATNTTLGCSGTDSTYISILPKPNVTIQPSDTIWLCSGTSVTLDAGSGFSQYVWNIGASTQSISAANSGTYIVTVTEPLNNCTNKDTVILIAVASPSVSISPSGIIDLCQGDSLQITATGSLNNYIWSNGFTTPDITVSTSGIYIVTVSDITGNCTDTDSVEVILNPLPNITASALGPTSFCIGDSVDLSIAGSAGNYQWFRYGTPILGGTGTVLKVKVKGNYHCKITDLNSCTFNSNSISVNTPCAPPQDPIEKSHTDEEVDNAQILIFPNPGTGFYDIKFSKKINAVDLQVMDLAGRIVAVSNDFTFINNSFYQIDISFVKSGVYLLQVKNDEKRIFRARIIRL